jgi:effector-binding domain-containing protein/uncharacterized protein YndB with AHSA1/START domain
MKFIKWFLIILAVIVVLVLAVAAFLPSSYKVERTEIINSDPENVFSLITDLKQWDKWSPWKAMDTAAVYAYNDTIGTGAEMSWTGEVVGSGKLRITSVTDTSVTYILTFIEPWESSSEGVFVIKGKGDSTLVSWSDNGKLAFPVERLMTVFMNFEEMLGPDFEKGLAALSKAINDNKWVYTYEIHEKNMEPFGIAVIRDTITMDEIGKTLGENYGEIMDVLKKQKVECTGPPMAISMAWEPTRWDFEAALPVSKEIKPSGRVSYKQSYAGKVIYVVYTGPYEKTEKAYLDLDNYVKENKLEEAGGPWEVYITDPATESDPAKWVTEIYFPVK